MYTCRFLNCTVLICVFLFTACKQDSSSTNASTSSQAVSPTDRVAWMSLEEAERASKTEPKDIFVMVYANWCPHCKNYDKTTYLDPKVINDLNTKFYPVKLNAHSNQEITYKGSTFSNPNYDSSKSENELNSYHEIVYELKAGSIPSIVFVDKNMDVKGAELGYKPAEELRSLMAMYRSN